MPSRKPLSQDRLAAMNAALQACKPTTKTDKSVSEICRETASGQLEINVPFHRSLIWTRAQKSCLIDCVVRGRHTPELTIWDNPDTTARWIVDGKQRVATFQEFINNGFSISVGRKHQSAFAGCYFRDLPRAAQKRLEDHNLRVIVLFSDHTCEDVMQTFVNINS